ncbi:hypothetical protein L914_01899 [Phytophthora nicotianae]|uniref:Apple domain-containing protein n=1 Tax=Phytophthora nicotianae TaxID=4792 RepID=W2P1G7_PHYNI|nr:hypothetical protein L914_01899 [Phytophthora nicotianae]
MLDRKNLVNAGVLLAIVGVSTCAAATCSSLESNTDYQGLDIGSARSASVNGCCSICSKTNECGAFTWTNYNGGTCWLKKSKGPTKVNNGAVSGGSSIVDSGIDSDLLVSGNQYRLSRC